MLPGREGRPRRSRTHLAGRQWLVGEGMTIADIDVYGVVAFAGEAGIDLADYPQIRPSRSASRRSPASRRGGPAADGIAGGGMTDLTIREARADDLEAIIRLHEEDQRVRTATCGRRRRGRPMRPPSPPSLAALRTGSSSHSMARRWSARSSSPSSPTSPGAAPEGQGREREVKAARRSGGIGARMIVFAEGYAREQGPGHGAHANKTRKDAHRFYERLASPAATRGSRRSFEGLTTRCRHSAQAGIHNLSVS